jgi:hypothetical protein
MSTQKTLGALSNGASKISDGVAKQTLKSGGALNKKVNNLVNRTSPVVGQNTKGDLDVGLRVLGSGVSVSNKGDITLGFGGVSITFDPFNADTSNVIDFGLGKVTIETTKKDCTITVTTRIEGTIVNQQTRQDDSDKCKKPDPTPPPEPSDPPPPKPKTPGNRPIGTSKGRHGWWLISLSSSRGSKRTSTFTVFTQPPKNAYSTPLNWRSELDGVWYCHIVSTDIYGSVTFRDMNIFQQDISLPGSIFFWRDIGQDNRWYIANENYPSYGVFPPGSGSTWREIRQRFNIDPQSYWRRSNLSRTILIPVVRELGTNMESHNIFADVLIAKCWESELQYIYPPELMNGYLSRYQVQYLGHTPDELTPRLGGDMPKDNECCEGLKDAIEDIYDLLGGDDFRDDGLEIPNHLFIPGGTGETKALTYNALLNLMFRTLDHRTVGEVEVSIKDNNIMKEGDQGLTMKLVNATAATGKILELSQKQDSDLTAVLNLLMRLSWISVQILKVVNIGSEATKTIVSFFAIPVKEKVINVDIPVDPSLGGKIGFDPKKPSEDQLIKILDLDDPQKTISIFDKFMNNSKIPVKVKQFIGDRSGGNYWWLMDKNKK